MSSIHIAERTTLSRNLGMLSILGTVFLVLLDYSVVNVGLPTIAEQFHATDSDIVWIVNTYQLVTFSVLLACAFLGKSLGYSFLARTGLVIFLLSSAGCALSTTLPELIACRALQGLGGGCILSVNMALVRFLFPPDKIGRAIALNGMAVAMGAACGPSLGSFILAVASWPWIFWVNIPLIIVILLLGWKTLPEFPLNMPSLKSLNGIIATVVGLASLGLSIDFIMHGKLISGPCVLLLSVASFVFLNKWQKKNKNWILAGYLLEIRKFRLPCIGCFLSFVSSNLYIVAMPFVLDRLFHKTPDMIGLLISPWALGVGILSFLMRRIMNYKHVTKVAALGMVFVSCCYVGLFSIPENASNISIGLMTFIGGVGFGMFQPPNNKNLILSAPNGEEGAASGFQATARLAGQSFGAAMVAGVYHYFPIPGRMCLVAAAAVALIGVVITLMESSEEGKLKN